MRPKARRQRASACWAPAGDMCFGSLNFFPALYMSADDCESAVRIDLGYK